MQWYVGASDEIIPVYVPTIDMKLCIEAVDAVRDGLLSTYSGSVDISRGPKNCSSLFFPIDIQTELHIQRRQKVKDIG